MQADSKDAQQAVARRQAASRERLRRIHLLSERSQRWVEEEDLPRRRRLAPERRVEDYDILEHQTARTARKKGSTYVLYQVDHRAERSGYISLLPLS